MLVCVGGRGVPPTARYAAGILSVMLHCDTQPDLRLAMPPYLSKQVEPA